MFRRVRGTREFIPPFCHSRNHQDKHKSLLFDPSSFLFRFCPNSWTPGASAWVVVFTGESSAVCTCSVCACAWQRSLSTLY